MKKKSRWAFKGSLLNVWQYRKLLSQSIKAWKDGSYRKISRKSIIMIIIWLIYFIAPADVITDAIPVLGLVDDATILAFAIRQIKKDLNF